MARSEQWHIEAAVVERHGGVNITAINELEQLVLAKFNKDLE